MEPVFDHSVRCPHCGGLNDLDAEWCMQCSERLRLARQKIDMDAGAPTMREIVGGGLDVVAGDPHEGFDEGIGQAFAVQGRAVKWTCSKCSHLNDIQATACAGCGTTFVDSARAIADAEMPKKQSKVALKAIGIVLGAAVVMRLVAGLISPWAAAGLLIAVGIRFAVRYLRA
jgi:ribosomal protein L40E